MKRDWHPWPTGGKSYETAHTAANCQQEDRMWSRSVHEAQNMWKSENQSHSHSEADVTTVLRGNMPNHVCSQTDTIPTNVIRLHQSAQNTSTMDTAVRTNASFSNVISEFGLI